jgi:hypothetical protein
VEVQLRKLLNRRISAERRAAAGAGLAGQPVSPGRRSTSATSASSPAASRRGARAADAAVVAPAGPARLLLLSGPSGSGKTSLLRAGLVPRLTRPFLFEQIATVRCARRLVHPGDRRRSDPALGGAGGAAPPPPLAS